MKLVCYLKLNNMDARGFTELKALDDVFTRSVPNASVIDLGPHSARTLAYVKELTKRGAPVIVTTSSKDDGDMMLSFEYGCDDYMVKPYSMKELSLRLGAIIRRNTIAHPVSTFVLRGSTMRLGWEDHSALIDGKSVRFSVSEWKILSFFASSPDMLLSRQQLMHTCFHNLTENYERTIDTHIKNIRLKSAMCSDVDWIETIRGYGYRFRGSLVTSDAV